MRWSQRLQLLIAALLQGRVACEINSGDELVATEVIFAGVLAELEPEEAVALLSAVVFQVSQKGIQWYLLQEVLCDVWFSLWAYLCSLCACLKHSQHVATHKVYLLAS